MNILQRSISLSKYGWIISENLFTREWCGNLLETGRTESDLKCCRRWRLPLEIGCPWDPTTRHAKRNVSDSHTYSTCITLASGEYTSWRAFKCQRLRQEQLKVFVWQGTARYITSVVEEWQAVNIWVNPPPTHPSKKTDASQRPGNCLAQLNCRNYIVAAKHAKYKVHAYLNVSKYACTVRPTYMYRMGKPQNWKQAKSVTTGLSTVVSKCDDE